MDSIIFVMDEGIGNMVMATPALQAIKKSNPKSELTVYGRYPALDVLKDATFVDHRTDKIDDDSHYDLALMSIWHQEFLSKYSQDFCNAHFTEAYKAEISNWDSHESTYHLALARDAKYELFEQETIDPFVSVTQDEGERDAICFELRTLGDYRTLYHPDKVIAISDTCLGGEWERKRWKGYPELAQRFIKDGYSVVLIGGDKEKQEFNPSDYPSEALPMFDLSVSETAYLLTQCTAFVGNDSGPAHIAGAVGINTHVIFGPTRWTKNKPLGKHVEVIRQALPCSPCQASSWWETCSTFECMTELPVDFVYESVMGKTIGEQRIESVQMGNRG